MLHFSRIRRHGFTLVELMAVVAILALVAVFAIPRIASFSYRAKITVAEKEMTILRDAFVDSESGYIADMRGIPGFSLSYLRIANLLIATNLYGEVSSDSNFLRGFQVDAEGLNIKGCARREEFIFWNDERSRGWRGPYAKGFSGRFPNASEKRFVDDADFYNRGFFPKIDYLRLPEEFSLNGASVYGFPGEPAIIDPWGNPYVLQIPPAQAFSAMSATNVSDSLRFKYARIVSAGPDGILSTPCFASNSTNDWMQIGTNWRNEESRRLSRQAGLIDGNNRAHRGDDLVLFLLRNDVDEGEEL
jgi:prepilin-type N-terminal cleavage/methylation domain-containing protein